VPQKECLLKARPIIKHRSSTTKQPTLFMSNSAFLGRTIEPIPRSLPDDPILFFRDNPFTRCFSANSNSSSNRNTTRAGGRPQRSRHSPGLAHREIGGRGEPHGHVGCYWPICNRRPGARPIHGHRASRRILPVHFSAGAHCCRANPAAECLAYDSNGTATGTGFRRYPRRKRGSRQQRELRGVNGQGPRRPFRRP
jgi:hypothetical protein